MQGKESQSQTSFVFKVTRYLVWVRLLLWLGQSSSNSQQLRVWLLVPRFTVLPAPLQLDKRFVVYQSHARQNEMNDAAWQHCNVPHKVFQKTAVAFSCHTGNHRETPGSPFNMPFACHLFKLHYKRMSWSTGISRDLRCCSMSPPLPSWVTLSALIFSPPAQHLKARFHRSELYSTVSSTSWASHPQDKH